MTGFWSPATANVDWCEPNYQYSFYIAEFFNTLSSIPIATCGIIGLRQCIKYNYETRFFIANIFVIIVGFGSMAFHGTLLRSGQVLDEVPMLWSTLAMLYIAFLWTTPAGL